VVAMPSYCEQVPINCIKHHLSGFTVTD
jgi:hypothetical protein